MSRAAELLFDFIGVVPMAIGILYFSTRQIKLHIGMPMKGLRRNDVDIVEKAGIKIYNTLISQLKSVIPVPCCSLPQFIKITDLLLIIWYNLIERA